MLENVVCQKHENGRTERTSTHIQERNCWRLGRKIYKIFIAAMKILSVKDLLEDTQL